MESVIEFVIGSFSSIFSLFSSFEFYGITLLDYLLALLVLGVMLPIVLTFNSSVLSQSSKYMKSEVSKARRREH